MPPRLDNSRNHADAINAAQLPGRSCAITLQTLPLERPVYAAGCVWSIGLAAWIIQDGNYADFTVGDRAEFALEF